MATLKLGKQTCAEFQLRLLALVGAHGKTSTASPSICFCSSSSAVEACAKAKARPSLAERGIIPPNLHYLQVLAVRVGQVVCHPPTHA